VNLDQFREHFSHAAGRGPEACLTVRGVVALVSQGERSGKILAISRMIHYGWRIGLFCAADGIFVAAQ